MVRTLVLVRHGKARGAREGEEDAQRRLTHAGRRVLEVAYPSTLSLLAEGSDATVWTSQAVRAQQTAAVVAGALGAADPEVHPSLAGGDPEAFLAELRECEGGCVVAVGHIPFMPKVVQGLVDTRLDFHPGAMACIGFASADASQGQLLWFVDGPDREPWETLFSLEDALAKAGEEVGAAAAAAQADPSPDKVHDLRVATRTARSLLRFASPWQRDHQARQVRQVYASVQEATSRLRDLDVLCDAVVMRASAPLAAALAEERADEAAKVAKRLGKKSFRRDLAAAEQGMADVAWRESVRADGLTRDQLTRRFDRLEARLERAKAQAGESDQALHEARKQAKALRYVAERLAALVGDERAAQAQGLKDLQEEAGATLDIRAMARLASQLALEPRFADTGDELIALSRGEVAEG